MCCILYLSNYNQLLLYHCHACIIIHFFFFFIKLIYVKLNLILRIFNIAALRHTSRSVLDIFWVSGDL